MVETRAQRKNTNPSAVSEAGPSKSSLKAGTESKSALKPSPQNSDPDPVPKVTKRVNKVKGKSKEQSSEASGNALVIPKIEVQTAVSTPVTKRVTKKKAAAVPEQTPRKTPKLEKKPAQNEVQAEEPKLAKKQTRKKKVDLPNQNIESTSSETGQATSSSSLLPPKEVTGRKRVKSASLQVPEEASATGRKRVKSASTIAEPSEKLRSSPRIKKTAKTEALKEETPVKPQDRPKRAKKVVTLEVPSGSQSVASEEHKAGKVSEKKKTARSPLLKKVAVHDTKPVRATKSKKILPVVDEVSENPIVLEKKSKKTKKQVGKAESKVLAEIPVDSNVQQAASVTPSPVIPEKSPNNQEKVKNTPKSSFTSSIPIRSRMSEQTSVRPKFSFSQIEGRSSFHSKVWHSPIASTSNPLETSIQKSHSKIINTNFRANLSSPPIQSMYAKKIAAQVAKTPFRESDKLPVAFYVNPDENQLNDSNAENQGPDDYVTEANSRVSKRSPLKTLDLPEGDVSAISVANTTFCDQSYKEEIDGTPKDSKNFLETSKLASGKWKVVADSITIRNCKTNVKPSFKDVLICET